MFKRDRDMNPYKIINLRGKLKTLFIYFINIHFYIFAGATAFASDDKKFGRLIILIWRTTAGVNKRYQVNHLFTNLIVE